MPSPLLTIAIPTFNRAKHLRLLLTALAQELRGLQGKVLVIVGDNASQDDTPLVTAEFLTACPTAVVVRHPHNLGAEENFCDLQTRTHSRYFWIFGDDDMPQPGVVAQVVGLLERERIDLLYLNSEWMRDISLANPVAAYDHISAQAIARADFAGRVHVWFTFISSMVVNLERLRELNPDLKPERYLGSNLVQLGWVLPLLMKGEQFRYVENRCVLATAANTGGYRPCEVFGTNFPAVVRAICGPDSPECKQILRGLAWDYLPKLLWSTRFQQAGAFTKENPLLSLAPLRSSLAYWMVFVPLAKLPRLLATPFLVFSMVIARGRQVWQ